MAYSLSTLSRALRNSPEDSVLRGKGRRIDNEGAAALIGLALFFDLLQMVQLIPVIGVLFAPLSLPITILAYVVILVAVKTFFKNIPLLGGAQAMMRMGSIFASIVIEFIPLISAIPAITPGVIALIVSVRLEDMGKEKMLPTATDLLSKKRRAAFEARQSDQLVRAETEMVREFDIAKKKNKEKDNLRVQPSIKGRGTPVEEQLRRGARAFDTKERLEGLEEGHPQEREQFERGDRVRLTSAKVRALRRDGTIASFPATSGTIMNSFAGGYSVQFGLSRRDVLDTDIERA